MAGTPSPKKRGRPSVDFQECIAALAATQRGQERNMYPLVRDLFIHFLDYRPEDILTDTANAAGDIPDLAVLAAIGVNDGKDRPIRARWLVLEAKDEPDAFALPEGRARIFAQKSKYIELETAWFVMLDPSVLVLRPVTSRAAEADPARDTVIRWQGLTEAAFRAACAPIAAAQATVNARLQAFRDGDESHIAEVKLRAPSAPASLAENERLERARAEFYTALRTGAQLLQSACRRALAGQAGRAFDLGAKLEAFRAAYGGCDFCLQPFHLQGHTIDGYEAKGRHLRDVREFHDLVRREPALARLGCFTLPDFVARAEGDRERALDLLASESASLVLARCMMLRFFEDHGFFGAQKYLCNGGVVAYRAIFEKYGENYARILREAYAAGSEIFPAVFGEEPLDWVLATKDRELSTAVERVLFYLSHYDFATIEQDVLSEIYGQFLDTAQRKRLGEHYTPPSIARYIVKRLGLRPGDRVLDPACGLGTFLIEAYKVLGGAAAAQGVATYGHALAALEATRGNDLNGFSAMIAQLQLLWHFFIFRDDIRRSGFPQARISGGFNSLHCPPGLFDSHLDDFSLIDTPDYAAVVGNPPYVRPERQEAALSREDARYYDAEISSKIDLYSLFLYKALDAWCRPNGTVAPGKVGFVLPLSFCDNDDNRALRRLFAPGGRWRILEIVDLELIGPLVFQADVVPMILIAEKKPAGPDDTILLRVADERCTRITGYDQKHVEFDLNRATEVRLPYADVFSADGRILTKLTPERKKILDRFVGATFDDVVQKFWVGYRKSKIERWSLTRPEKPDDLRWEQADMLRRGAVFRGSVYHDAKRGLDVFKGENITAGRIEGAPVDRQIDVNRMDDPALWRFADIVPQQGFAFHQIATSLTAAPFSPRACVFLDTASLFFPQAALADFPFDFLVQSRLYQYVFALREREGILFRARCHVYPSTIRRLPWSPKLAAHAEELRTLRTEYLTACANLHRRAEMLRAKLGVHSATTLSAAVVLHAETRVEWSDDLRTGGRVAVGVVSTYERDDGWWVVLPGDDLTDWIALNDGAIAQAFAAGLELHAGAKLDRATLLALPIPEPDTLSAWRETVEKFDAHDYAASLRGVLDRLDRLVARAFKVTADELKYVKADFATDPMLRRVRPNLPFAARDLKGLRGGLESGDRYDKAYKTRG